jgi:hypothetical protein
VNCKTVGYDAAGIGNITLKSDAGSYSYPAPGSARPHAVASVTGSVDGITNPLYAYDANGNMTCMSTGAGCTGTIGRQVTVTAWSARFARSWKNRRTLIGEGDDFDFLLLAAIVLAQDDRDTGVEFSSAPARMGSCCVHGDGVVGKAHGHAIPEVLDDKAHQGLAPDAGMRSGNEGEIMGARQNTALRQWARKPAGMADVASG